MAGIGGRVTEQIKIALGWDLGAFQSGLGEIKKGLGDNTKETTGWADALKAGAAVAAGVGAAVVGYMLGGVQGARELNAQIKNSNALWGDQAGAVIQWGKDAVQTYGITQAHALKAVNVLGQMLQNQGVATDQALEMSQEYIRVGAALDSAFSLDRGYTVDAITSALQGNYQMLRNVGVMTNATEVSQRALAMTGKESVSQLTAQDKALALNAIVMEQSKNAVEAYGDGSSSLGLQQAKLQAALEQVQTEAGQKLLPVLLQLFKFLNDNVIPVFSRLVDVVTGNPAAFAALAGAAVALAGAFKAMEMGKQIADMAALAGQVLAVLAPIAAQAAAWLGATVAMFANTAGKIANTVATWAANAATSAWTAAQWLLNAALLANPIGIIIILIVALVAAFILAYKNSETFRNIVTGAFNAVVGAVQAVITFIGNLIGTIGSLISTAARVTGIGSFFQSVASVITGAFSGVVGIINGVISAIENLIRKAGQIKDAIGGALGGILGLSAEVPEGLAPPVVAAYGALAVPAVMPTGRSDIGGPLGALSQSMDRLMATGLPARGPALQLNQPVFREEADVTVLLRKTQFAVEAGRL